MGGQRLCHPLCARKGSRVGSTEPMTRHAPSWEPHEGRALPLGGMATARPQQVVRQGLLDHRADGR